MIKIFSLNKIIYLIDDKNDFNLKKDAILISVNSAKEMLIKYNELTQNEKPYNLYFFNKDIKTLFKYFSGMFRLIEAAGGLVRNKKNEYLFIFRNGKWDLPKGKIEKGEGVKTAAIREVEEECGISKLTITKKITATYHIYLIKEKAILKCTYWFEMDCKDTAVLVPQTDEGITDARWIAKGNWKIVFDNTFESILEVLKNESVIP